MGNLEDLAGVVSRCQTGHLKTTVSGGFSFAAGIVARTELLARRPVEDCGTP